jgi:hypothetical protein
VTTRQRRREALSASSTGVVLTVHLVGFKSEWETERSQNTCVFFWRAVSPKQIAFPDTLRLAVDVLLLEISPTQTWKAVWETIFCRFEEILKSSDNKYAMILGKLYFVVPFCLFRKWPKEDRCIEKFHFLEVNETSRHIEKVVRPLLDSQASILRCLIMSVACQSSLGEQASVWNWKFPRKLKQAIENVTNSRLQSAFYCQGRCIDILQAGPN